MRRETVVPSDLQWRSADFRLTPMPEIAALITALILERSMCLDCITSKATRPPEDIERYLSQMERLLTLRRQYDRSLALGRRAK